MTTCSAPLRVRHTSSVSARRANPALEGGTLVGERASRGHRERPAERDGRIRQNGIGDRDRLTGQRPGCGIEWLHHQRAAAHEDQRVLRDLEVRPALHQPDALARPVECRYVGRNRREPLVSHVQEVPAVGEEVGEAVPVFAARRVRRGQRFERSAQHRDALELRLGRTRAPRVSLSTYVRRADVRRADDDHVARTPVPLTFWPKNELSPIVSGGPPARSTFRSLPSAKNAT